MNNNNNQVYALFTLFTTNTSKRTENQPVHLVVLNLSHIHYLLLTRGRVRLSDRLTELKFNFKWGEVTLWLTVSQYDLLSSALVGLVTRYYFLSECSRLKFEICGLVSVGRPLWREDGSEICSVITQRSESRRTCNHTLLSHLRLPQPGGPGSPIYIPQEQHAIQLYSPAGTLIAFCIWPRKGPNENTQLLYTVATSQTTWNTLPLCYQGNLHWNANASEGSVVGLSPSNRSM
jgi:hypothetical protein